MCTCCIKCFIISIFDETQTILKRNVYVVLVETPEGKRLSGKPRPTAIILK
jgi:hypothetical protein